VTTRSHFCSQYFTHAALDMNWGWDKEGSAMPAKPTAKTAATTAPPTEMLFAHRIAPFQ